MALITNIIKSSSAERLLLLVHGYGADERDLGALLAYLDPSERFATVLPRGPHDAPGSPGFAWYQFHDPDAIADAFTQSLDALDDLLEEQCALLGFDRSQAVVAGFSQGAGLVLALGLRRSDRQRPAAVVAMSPAVPDIELLDIDPSAAGTVAVLIQHGNQDPMIPIKSARAVARSLSQRAIPVVFREYAMQHNVTLDSMRDSVAWLDLVFAGELPNEPVADDPIELVPSVTTSQWAAEVLQSEVAVIVDFWAPWCEPCKQVAPIIDQMSRMRAGSYKFVKVNIDEEPQLAQQYGVQSIPMIGLFRNGKMERSVLGAKPRTQLEAELGMLVIP